MARYLAIHPQMAKSDELLFGHLSHVQVRNNYSDGNAATVLMFSLWCTNVMLPLDGDPPSPKFDKVDFTDVYKVEFIVQKRKVGRKQEFLLKWHGCPWTFSTWQTRADVLSCGDVGETLLEEFESMNLREVSFVLL